MENQCVNCTAFVHKTGSTRTAETMKGECRASIPKAGGTRWALVSGEDGCRDGFDAKDAKSLALQDVK